MSARSWSRTSAKVSVSHGRLCQSLFAHHGRPVSQYHLGDSNNIFFLTLSLVFSVFVTFSEHGDRVSPHPMLSLTQLTLHQGRAGSLPARPVYKLYHVQGCVQSQLFYCRRSLYWLVSQPPFPALSAVQWCDTRHHHHQRCF